MKNKLCLPIFVVAIFVMGTGCGRTRLASRPLTEQETAWARVIRSSYPGWRPPLLPAVQATEPAADGASAWPLGKGAVPGRPGATRVPAAHGSGVGAIGVAPDDEIELVPVVGGRQPGARAPAQDYVVRQGDTLSGLAEEFFGDANDWRRIFEYNRDVLTSPDELAPGTVLKLPAADAAP